VLLLSWPLPIPGAGHALYEPSLHPHTLGAGLALWSLALLLEELHAISAALAVLAALVHPLAGLSALLGGFFGATVFGWRATARWALTAAVLLAAAAIAWPTRRAHLPLLPVDWWVAAARESCLWVWDWSSSAIAAFALWFALAALVWTSRRDRALVCLTRFGTAGVALLAVALIGMQLQSPLLVSLQLHRGFLVFEFVTIVFAVKYLIDALAEGRAGWLTLVMIATAVSRHSALVVLAAIVAAVLIASPQLPTLWRLRLRYLPLAAAALSLLVPARGRYVLHAPDGWIALQEWARRETPVDARFLAPLNTPDFRIYSERSSVLGAQDTEPAIFDEDLAHAVAERRPVAHAYEDRDCTALSVLAYQFDARFIVTAWPCAGHLVHQADGFYVYERE